MRHVTSLILGPALRVVPAFALVAVAALAAPGSARGQAESTYRVILYIAEDGAPGRMSLQRLDEVWSEGDGPARLQQLLEASSVRRLEEVTVLPNRDTPALRMGDVTVRVRGAYREPRRDAMFLRVEVEGGQETFVKEMVSKFDETILVAYPLAEGDRSLVALIVPTEVGP